MASTCVTPTTSSPQVHACVLASLPSVISVAPWRPPPPIICLAAIHLNPKHNLVITALGSHAHMQIHLPPGAKGPSLAERHYSINRHQLREGLALDDALGPKLPHHRPHGNVEPSLGRGRSLAGSPRRQYWEMAIKGESDAYGVSGYGEFYRLPNRMILFSTSAKRASWFIQPI